MKKLLLTLFLLLPASALAVDFPDIHGHPHETNILQLADAGVVQGYPSGLFGPDLPINRAEFLKIVMRASAGIDESGQPAGCFTDFYGETQWFWSYACAAQQQGIISGYPDGSFRGIATINLAEAMKIITKAWAVPVRETAASDAWYAPYTEFADQRGVYNSFYRNPAHLLTRSDMAFLITSLGLPIQGSVVAGSSSSAGSIAYCGNGIKEAPETCDDGNRNSGDGCSASCQSEGLVIVETDHPICGNGVLETGEQCDDGNTENRDGCSEICVIVPETVQHGSLVINQDGAMTDAVTAGAQNVSFLAFSATAGRQNVVLSGLRFALSASAKQYLSGFELQAKAADGSWTTVAGTAAQGSTVTFSGLDYLVRDGYRTDFRLVADVSTNASGGPFTIGFDTGSSVFVQASGAVDGRELTGITVDGELCSSGLCWIEVNTESAQIGVNTTGSIYVETSSAILVSHQLLAGSTTPDLLRFDVEADDEPINITQIRVQGYPSSAFQLFLHLDDSSSPIGTLSPSVCSPRITGDACANVDVIVQPDTTVTFSVRASLKSDTDGAVANETVQLRLPASNSRPGIIATGVNSQTDLFISDSDDQAVGEIVIGRSSPGASTDLVGPAHDVVFAQISTIANGSTAADGSSILTGTQPLGAFTFAAATNQNSSGGRNEVILDQIKFIVSAVNVTIDPATVVLLDPLQTSAQAACSASSASNTIEVTCSGLAASALNTRLGSGDSRTFRLRATIQSVNDNGGTALLQARIQQLGSRSELGSVIWSDEETTHQWVDIDTDAVASTRYEN